MVVVLLGGKGRGGEHGNDKDKHQHQCRHALPVGLNGFVHIVAILQISYFGHKKAAVLRCGKTSPVVLTFPKKSLANAKAAQG